MTPQDFTYWLQGFAELNGDTPPTEAQWKSIREHLALAFTKVTPPLTAPLQYPPVDRFPLRDQRPLQAECSGGTLQGIHAQTFC